MFEKKKEELYSVTYCVTLGEFMNYDTIYVGTRSQCINYLKAAYIEAALEGIDLHVFDRKIDYMHNLKWEFVDEEVTITTSDSYDWRKFTIIEHYHVGEYV